MKKTKYPSETSTSLNIKSFSKGINTSLDRTKIPIDYAYDIKNFSFENGILKEGIGFSELIDSLSTQDTTSLKRDFETLGEIEKVFHFYIYNQNTNKREDKLIFINHELKVYYISLYEQPLTLNSIRNISFKQTPIATQYRLNGEDVMIFSSLSDNMYVWNGREEPYEVLDAPKISSMALHYERLFVTVDGEKSSIWFSDDLDPTNWSISLDEAGFIDLIDERGALLKVVSFFDYLYVFREYGISRITAYGNQHNFSVSNLYVSSGKIYENSVCVCGDKIIFLAEDGLYKFDGVDTIKILDNISNNLTKQTSSNISSCYYNGKYYLSCNYNFLDQGINNALLEIDINKYKLTNITFGVSIKYITCINTEKYSGIIAISKLNNSNNSYVTEINKTGKFLDNTLEKTWTSPISDIEKIQNIKTLKKIFLQTSTPIIITIFHDNKETIINFPGSLFPQTKRVCIPLINFGFKISCKEKSCSIKNIRFLFSSVNGRV